MCDETYRRRKVAHRVSAISSSSKSDNSSNEKDDNDEQFAPTKEGEQNEVLQSTDEEKLGRAAQYMRELIKRQVRSNDLPRAGSLTDSTVLRRKGRLKEQDPLIEFMVEMHKTHTTEEVMQKVEGWINETLQFSKKERRCLRDCTKWSYKLGIFSTRCH